MGYYCTLTNVLYEVDKLCTIVLPLTEYENLWTSDDNTQCFGYVTRQINKLLYIFEFVCVNIDDLITPPRGDWVNHMKKIETTLEIPPPPPTSLCKR